jgi:hypothetical protein
VLSEYLWKVVGHTPTAWEEKGVDIAGYSVAYLLVAFTSLWLSNFLSSVKLATLIFISITGLVVLGGHNRVKDPKTNIRGAFVRATTALYGIFSPTLAIRTLSTWLTK